MKSGHQLFVAKFNHHEFIEIDKNKKEYLGYCCRMNNSNKNEGSMGTIDRLPDGNVP